MVNAPTINSTNCLFEQHSQDKMVEEVKETNQMMVAFVDP
jgi:hypothetical protein